MENIVHTTVKIGIDKPFQILHITDVHLTYANEQDNEYYHGLMEKRTKTFHDEGKGPEKTPAAYFAESIAYAEKIGATLVCTGDTVDLPTHGNMEMFHRIADGHDMLFCLGGHEQQKRFVRTMEEGNDYYLQSRAFFAKEFPNFPLDFDHRIVNGVNLVMLDNSLDYFNRETAEKFFAEIKRGLPMLVFAHDPIDDEYLVATEKTHPNVPLTEEDYTVSHRVIDEIRHNPLVKAFIAGHEHAWLETTMENGSKAYATEALFKGECRLIDVI